MCISNLINSMLNCLQFKCIKADVSFKVVLQFSLSISKFLKFLTKKTAILTKLIKIK